MGARGRGRGAGGLAALASAAAVALGASAGAAGDGLPDLGEGPGLPVELLIEFARTGVAEVPGLVPEIGEYASALRYAWAQSAKKYAVFMDEHQSCDLGIEESLESPPDIDAGEAWESANVDESVDEALRLLEDIDSCIAGLAGTSAPVFANIGRYNSGAQKFSESGRIAAAASQFLNSPVRLVSTNFFRSRGAPGSEVKLLELEKGLRRDHTRMPLYESGQITAWCPLSKVDASTHSVPVYMPNSYNSNAFLRGHTSVWRRYEQSVSLIQSGERGDETTHYKDIPNEYLDIEEGYFPFYTEMAMYSKRPISDRIQSYIDRFCQNVEQGIPFDVTKRNLCILSDSTNASMDLVREMVANDRQDPHPEKSKQRLETLFEAQRRYAEAVWTWGGGVRVREYYDLGDCTFHHGRSFYATPPAGSEVTEAVLLTFVKDSPLNYVFPEKSWNFEAFKKSRGTETDIDFKLLTEHFFPPSPDGGLDWLDSLPRWPREG